MLRDGGGPIDELNEVTARVREQLGELLDTLDRDGGKYARAYAEWYMLSRSRTRNAPRPPLALLPVAEVVRELVRDEATSVRMYGRRREQRDMVTASLLAKPDRAERAA